jgi:predicted DsbA family dithiol-disulfide isomerase
MQLLVVSDAICPWCYVGKRRLEKALSLVPDLPVRVTWRPFELNPDMPKEGVERSAYRTRKFGSLEKSRELDLNVAAVGAQEGLEFRHELMQRTPNTIDAHRLIWLADREGVQEALVDALFKAYFSQGQDIGDASVLAKVGAAAGIEAKKLPDFLAGSEGLAEVRRYLQEARGMGLNGVPSFIFPDRSALTGAQPAEVIAQHLRRVGAAAA